MTTGIVLVHGGSFAASCWDLVVDRLDAPVLAVDLPGRGVHPAAPHTVTIDDAAASVVRDIDRAGFDAVVLAGHSLAGCSMPATIGRLGARVQAAVFVACTVPEDGTSAVDTLPADVQEMTRTALDAGAVGTLDPALAKEFFGNDLDDAQFAWMLERMVPETATRLLTEPVDLAPLHRADLRATWVRTLRDVIIDPEKQLRFARNVGRCDVVDLDAGHMCMISQPDALAAILDRVADGR
jgi:pimeloyl-ACP methyl ester carboxylesterase